jgi:anti-sigma-K factor RskA
MTEREDIDALAGEYVLGTLDAGERATVAARRQREPALDSAIMAWEHRLGPLVEGLLPVEPPSALLRGIESRLNGSASGAPDSSLFPAGADVVRLERRLRTWRRVAIAASSLAACLVVAIGVREATRQPEVGNVAVFVQGDVMPSFILSVDFETRTLSVKAVAAKPLPDKAYQLWIVHERLGGVPQSLGLIELDSQGISRRQIEYDRALLTTATFGVSVEPPGGSPTGRPSPGALHARLMPAAL